MSTLDQLEKAVAALPEPELDAFRRWYEEFEAERFDRKIEKDAKAGKLDALAQQALDDQKAGLTREI